MSNIILVTGATGTVGSETVKALSTSGAKVRAGVRSVIKGENLKRLPGVDVVEIDFARPETLAAAFTGVETAFLITPFSEDQVQLANQLTDAARVVGVKHVVRLSASGAEVEPGIQLGRWHREAEDFIKASGLAYTLLRPTSFMQNFSNQQGVSIRQENALYMPLGQGRVAYVDARDIGEVAAKILMTPESHIGREYTLTGPEALSSEEVANILSSVTNRNIQYFNVPEGTVRSSMRQSHVPEWMINSLLELHGMCRNGFASGTTSAVEEITGNRPRTFRDFAEAYKQCF